MKYPTIAAITIPSNTHKSRLIVFIAFYRPFLKCTFNFAFNVKIV